MGIFLRIEHGVDLDYIGAFGRNALMHAVQKNHLDVVKVLIDAGININFTDRHGNPLFMSYKFRTFVN